MLAEYLLVGLLLIIGVAEAAHLCALLLGCPLSVITWIFWGGVVLSGMLFLLYQMINKRRHPLSAIEKRQREREQVRRSLMGNGRTTGCYLLCGVFALLVLTQLATTATGAQLYLAGDMTAEQVNSILEANQVYPCHPLTGQSYQLGMPSRLRILCLPTFYAILCRSFSVSVPQMVWRVIPTAVVLLSCFAFWSVAKALFPGREEKMRLQRGGFMVLTALLVWIGSYAYGMDGFGLLYSGFRGVTIRNCVLLPFLFAALIQKKRLRILLCIVAEACMVWTLYGMGVCAAVTVIWYFCVWMGKRMSIEKMKRRQTRGDDTCRSF